MSELVVEPDVYTPCVDIQGNYIDKTPVFSKLQNGLRCPCGGRKDKYDTAATFTSHTKTKIHQKWLTQLTANKSNFYVENEEHKVTIYNQKRVIARLEQEIQNRNRTILFLTEQLSARSSDIETTTPNHAIGDLLSFD